MDTLRILSASEQVANRLRTEIAGGTLSGLMPGVIPLADALGVNRKTVVAAFRQLEEEGLLECRGQGRRRQVKAAKVTLEANQMRMGILYHERRDQQLGYLADLQHTLSESGHQVLVPGRSLMDLRMDPKRVSRLVATRKADAWIVVGGGLEVLEWFSRQPLPTFALFGRFLGLPMAGLKPDKGAALQSATGHLVKLGHRRIVLLVRQARREPEPGRAEKMFLAALQEAGIPAGPFHLPDWTENTDGLSRVLDSLFDATPPTALIVDEIPLLVATQQYLMNKGLRVPGDVSLVSTDEDPALAWCKPSMAQIKWDSGTVIRRIVRWASNVSKGRPDRRQTLTKARFINGGTVGPVPKT